MLKKLKDERVKRGLTNRDMADKLNITTEYYWMIENGKRRLSYKMAVKIASILESTPDQIFLHSHLTRD